MHEVPHASEAEAKTAAGVEIGEVRGFKAPAAAELQSERVAEGEHNGGGGGGGEVEAAGLSGDGDIQRESRDAGKGAGDAAGEGDDGNGETVEGGQDAEEFFSFSGVGEGEDDVACGDHAEVAVEGFRRMQEVGGGAGGAEGGGDLAGDDAGLPYAGKDDAMCLGGACLNEGEGLLNERLEVMIQAGGEGSEGGSLKADECGGRFRWAEFG